MIDLRDYARKQRGKEKTEILTARIPSSKLKKFKDLCKELNLSVNEAIYLLIDDQISLREGKSIQKNTLSITENEESITSDDISNTYTDTKSNTFEESLSKPVKNKPKRRTPSGGKRFTANPWKMDGEIPCPLCEKWTDFTNYARHSKKYHNGLSTREIFTTEEYVQIANEMLQERKEKEAPPQ